MSKKIENIFINFYGGQTRLVWLVGFRKYGKFHTYFEGFPNEQFLSQAAKNKVAICQQKIKAQKEMEKKTFANMFDKFAEIDKKKEQLERKKNARPDAMKNIDEWEG